MYVKFLQDNMKKAGKKPVTRWCLFLLGFLFFIPAAVSYLGQKRNDAYEAAVHKQLAELVANGEKNRLEQEVEQQLRAKQEFFGQHVSADHLQKEKERIVEIRLQERVLILLRNRCPSLKETTFQTFCQRMVEKPQGTVLFTVLAFPALLYLLILANPYVKYISGRLVMTLFVVFGVTILVFTILYMSPMDSAVNILGDLATQDQIEQFNEAYGLDQPYLVQLLRSFKGLITLDMGKSYVGNEDVIVGLMNRFPVTLTFTFVSLLLAVVIAIPSGIISALKPYSAIDYTVMLLALIGLSIPGFWLGLILILNMSIRWGLVPAIFVPGWQGYVMPAIVLGTGLAASVARMTRSSLLEVIKQDYIVTAKAKGLSKSKVVLRHALGNAMIPIITVIGIQFGMMLGGAAVIEKVFNMPGIGSYIVDKQFVPDVPVVLAGVVYIAIVISLTNLFVDILYAFLDPRIKAKLKSS